MTDFELPRNLVGEVEEHDSPDSPRRAWMAVLPDMVRELANRWSLELGRPFQPGGVTSWVAPAWNKAGEHVVLKVGWSHDEALHEADGLRLWEGRGAVRLLDSLVVDQANALLLEACDPGTALSRTLPPRQQDRVVASLLPRLWIEPPTGHPLRSLASMCDSWADEFEEKYAASRGFTVDPGLVRAGMELFRELPRTAKRSVVLCTDLHPENVLAAQREPWLIIDPNPYVGDPTYDSLQHMLNFPIRLSADSTGFVRRMASLLELDVDRLGQWLFARCVQESVDTPWLRSVISDLAP